MVSESEAIRQALERIVPALHRAGATFRPGRPAAFREGSVGWVADRPTLRISTGQKQELRLTVVFRREDDLWKAVLFQNALAVPDEQVDVFRGLAT